MLLGVSCCYSRSEVPTGIPLLPHPLNPLPSDLSKRNPGVLELGFEATKEKKV